MSQMATVHEAQQMAFEIKGHFQKTASYIKWECIAQSNKKRRPKPFSIPNSDMYGMQFTSKDKIAYTQGWYSFKFYS